MPKKKKKGNKNTMAFSPKDPFLCVGILPLVIYICILLNDFRLSSINMRLQHLPRSCAILAKKHEFHSAQFPNTPQVSLLSLCFYLSKWIQIHTPCPSLQTNTAGVGCIWILMLVFPNIVLGKEIYLKNADVIGTWPVQMECRSGKLVPPYTPMYMDKVRFP